MTSVPESFLTSPHNECLATVVGTPARGKPYVVHVTSDMTSWHPSPSSLKCPPQLSHRAFGTLWLFQVSLLQRHLMSLTLSSSAARTSGIPTVDLLAILINEGRKKQTNKPTQKNQEEIKMLSNYFTSIWPLSTMIKK